MSFKIGIDVGGTFTDLFLWSSAGDVETYKTLSTPDDPSVGVLEGLRSIAAAHGLEVDELAAQVTTIVHGTTVTTNASLTRGGRAVDDKPGRAGCCDAFHVFFRQLARVTRR